MIRQQSADAQGNPGKLPLPWTEPREDAYYEWHTPAGGIVLGMTSRVVASGFSLVKALRWAPIGAAPHLKDFRQYCRLDLRGAPRGRAQYGEILRENVGAGFLSLRQLALR